jgi:hypothetical protein
MLSTLGVFSPVLQWLSPSTTPQSNNQSKIRTMEKVVRVFDSFEEADTADALSRAQLTPQQRAGIFFELRERAHPDAFKQGFARVYRVLELERS